MSRPITIRDAHGSVTAPPERMQALLAERAAVKTPTVKAARAAALRKRDKRIYPHFVEGMTTEQYVETYWGLNGQRMGLACSHNHRTGVSTPLEGEIQRLIAGFYEPLSQAPQYSQPDLVEEACDE